MAQVVAHLIGNEEVTGSTPVISLQEDDPSDHPFLCPNLLPQLSGQQNGRENPAASFLISDGYCILFLTQSLSHDLVS